MSIEIRLSWLHRHKSNLIWSKKLSDLGRDCGSNWTSDAWRHEARRCRHHAAFRRAPGNIDLPQRHAFWAKVPAIRLLAWSVGGARLPAMAALLPGVSPALDQEGHKRVAEKPWRLSRRCQSAKTLRRAASARRWTPPIQQPSRPAQAYRDPGALPSAPRDSWIRRH